MVIENCKKIEPVVVKLRSKAQYTTFFLNTVYTPIAFKSPDDYQNRIAYTHAQ